jgi:predicted TIM-barrel fold metal-dependent hydrolase
VRATRNVPDLESLRLFDSCLTLGRLVLSGCPEWLSAEKALAAMDRYGIAEALVHDHSARRTHPRADGNRRLLEAVKGLPRLHPCWVIEPPERPGRDAARALVAGMLAAGVRAARLPMKSMPPLAWLWDDLCAEIEAHRVPCFLDFGEVGTVGAMTDGDVDGVRDIALAHPELPLVLSAVLGPLGVHPAVLPLLRRVPNVHIDTVGVLGYWQTAARDAGPERALFATAAPFMDPGIYASGVQYEPGLDEAAKRLVAGGNLRRMLEAVR